jgi:pectate lyase
VLFDVAGTISLGSDLLVKGANVTIDGFSAPSPGITLKNRTLLLQGTSGASNIVVRGLRHRSAADDAVRIIYNASNIVIDHVSISGFGDGAIDITEGSRDVTIQWSVLGNGSAESPNANLLAIGAKRISVHHNVYLNNGDRHPKCGGETGATAASVETTCDVRNNLIWNYKWMGSTVRSYATGNVVNNYYYSAQATANAAKTIWVAEGGVGYVSGNYSQNGWNLNASGNRSTPYPAPLTSTTDAITAAQQVLANAGARGPKFGLDAADQDALRQISLNPH